MRSTLYPMNGAWAKYSQACDHRDRFIALFKEFNKSHPSARIVRNDESVPHEPGAGVGSDDVWYELGCAAGDCVHNLRSALDHVAYAVAASRKIRRSYLSRVYFTICATESDFNRKMKKDDAVEPVIGADWITFLRSVQPFADAKYEDLGRIARLDNIDKHRTVTTLTPRADVAVQRKGEDWEHSTVTLESGPVLMPQDGPIFMMVRPYLTFDDAPGRAKQVAVEDDLMNFYCLIGDVMHAAKDAFF